VVGTFAAAAWWRLWLPLVSPLVLLVACPGAFLGLRAMEARREATRRRAIFAKFVNPTLVDRLLGQDEVALQGERRELTVLFCDIRGFTTMSEEMDPQEVSGALAEHFNRLTPVLLRHEGTLDKYIGDALMAFFGAPVHQADHARRAVAAALEMASESRRLAEERASRQDRTWPPFRVGFGLASGPCHVGLVGSDEVFNYSVLGDTVNLAARLEGLTKDLGCEVLLSEETWTLVQDSFDGRFVGEVEVKGKRRKVRVFTVRGPRPVVS
jgi:adenylate cyclase